MRDGDVSVDIASFGSDPQGLEQVVVAASAGAATKTAATSAATSSTGANRRNTR